MKNVLVIPDAWQEISALFIALGDPHRQRILLAFERQERLSIMEILAASSLSRTAVSYHLRVLHQSGALSSEKVGKQVYYWINRDWIAASMKQVLTYIENET